MPNTELTDDAKDAIIAAIKAGKKIDAIKLYREATGVGLKEAKEDVEALIDVLAKDDPDIKKANQGSGCAAMLVAIFTLGYFITQLASHIL
jgi:ribosomal protein L7/L12